MPMLASNPHEATCPDFTSEKYLQARECLLNDAINHEAAANQLELLWTVNNDLERQEWDRQTLAEQEANKERERLAAEERERLWQELKREQEIALQEDKKKYRNKYAPVLQDVAVPMDTIIVLAPIASCRLRKGDYCELYFFTNKGLQNAELTPCSTDDDAMALLQSGDGLHTFVPIAAARAKGNVTKDEDLSWEEFSEAAHRLVAAMKENNWEKENVDNHVKFWLALENHPWRHGSCAISKSALLVYQARVRRKWHDTLNTGHSFNIALVNDRLLANIRDELVHSARVAELDSLKRVSLSTPSLRRSEINNFFDHPKIFHI
ncbi:hypothetical protein M404DRAFT_26070 [Pisolithus tinctorius Marx 270]|uniref:Uncharacterized protein n=1 Tax=Pisolithus tinctorius Marx 270 TaxID=870435 RepID=A0A0C3NUQ6_PISTI|nr:hypothetical protein M404DRAFT_26070 [Pisolithus tinctorius Marx 270]